MSVAPSTVLRMIRRSAYRATRRDPPPVDRRAARERFFRERDAAGYRQIMGARLGSFSEGITRPMLRRRARRSRHGQEPR